jgi:DNA (cytosine-5)-methyltransferase 1
MSNYYNEHDPKAAEWLRQLIKAELIPDGDVDERSITEINANELYPYTQCHFFAGIGGWSLALQLAGWPADKPVWTGSCPCQPFSSAGKKLAQKDERHLWPAFFNLIRECRPDTVFGEQVASAIGHGWLDGISSDLESEDYACGATVLGAHSVGAPHIRQRLYWVADSNGKQELATDTLGLYAELGSGGSDGRLADSELCRRERVEVEQCTRILKTMDGEEEPQFAVSAHSASSDRLADSGSAGLEGHRQSREQSIQEGRNGEERHTWTSGTIFCRDGKTRRIPTEPAFFPLANGIPARVVRLRGYGNAIVPQVAASFIEAFTSTIENTPTHE